jgi:hypothetical protein
VYNGNHHKETQPEQMMITKILHTMPQNAITAIYDVKMVRKLTGLCAGECFYIASGDSDDYFVVGLDLLTGKIIMRYSDDSIEINVPKSAISH